MESNKLHINEYYKQTLNGKDIIIRPEKSWKFIKEKNVGREELYAFSENGKKMTYRDMYEQWDEVAKVLSGLDMYRGNNSRILVLMPNLTKTGVITYGSDMTGAVVDFIDPTSSYDKIRKYVEEEKITDIIGLDLLILQNIGKKIEELKKDFNLNSIIVYKDPFMNFLMPSKIKLVSNVMNFTNIFNKNVIRYEDAVRNTRDTSIKYDTTDGDVLDFITHTSGTTTGIGKPIPLTDYNRNSLVNEYDLAGFDWQPGMKMLHFIPYFAGYGTVNTAHLGLSNGVELQQIPLFNPMQFGEYVCKYKPNVVVATTPCWLNLVENPEYENVDLSFLSVAATGGSPTSMEDELKIDKFFLQHGAKTTLMVGYGMSEFGGCVITDNDKYNKPGSTGVPLPGVDVRFRNNETGEITDMNTPNIEGEALIHSETMSSGILDSKKIFDTVVIDGKNFVSTRDIMKSDELGHIHYIGRTDGMFQRYDGYNVYPLYIEELLKSYDEIADCALIKEYDEGKKGNIPKVIIQLKDEICDKSEFISNIIDESFLKNTKLEQYKANFRDVPHKWNFVSQIPKNTMGKTDLHKLLTEDIEGEEYFLIVTEDNMSLKNYEIKNERLKAR